MSSLEEQEKINSPGGRARKRSRNFIEMLEKPGEDRIVMLGDAIFAIAITLFVLGIQIPSGQRYPDFVASLKSDFLVNTIFYVITFAILAVYWLNRRQLMNFIVRLDRAFLWLNLVFLAFVAFFPVASNLLLRYAHFSEAVIIYTIVLAGCGYSSTLLWIYAFAGHRLVPQDQNISHSLARFGSVFIVPTFLLLSLFLLYIPSLNADPSNVFYFWLLLPVMNIILVSILRFSLRGQAGMEGAERENDERVEREA